MCHYYYLYCDIFWSDLNCNYLLSVNGDIECSYQHVQCPDLPRVMFAFVYINRTESKETEEYSCNEGFTLEGNSTMTCMNNGKWLTPPQCIPVISSTMGPAVKSTPAPGSRSWVTVIMIIFTVHAILGTIALVTYNLRMKANPTPVLNRQDNQGEAALREIDYPLKHFRREEDKEKITLLKRNRQFDAFVLYHFDTNYDLNNKGSDKKFYINFVPQ